MSKQIKSEWFYYFVVLAEAKNFRTAAEQLYVSQPALSNFIVKLERFLGADLLIHNKQGFELTEAGMYFLQTAQLALQQLQRLSYLPDYTDKQLVRIASTLLWWPGDEIYQLCLQHLQQGMLNLHLSFPEPYLEADLLKKYYDLAFGRRPPQSSQLDFKCLAQTPMVIIGLPQPKRAWQDLTYIRLCGFSASSDISIASDAFWPEKHYPRSVITETNSIPMIMYSLKMGRGAAYLPQKAVQKQLDTGELAIIADSPEEQIESAYLIWNNVRQEPPYIAKLREQIFQYF